MTDIEFLELYQEQCLKMINDYIQILKNNSQHQCEYLFKLFDDHNSEISYKQNILISQLMDDNGLDYTAVIIEGFNTTPIENFLFKKAFCIILDCNAYYKKVTDALFLELLCFRK